jgi:ubiquinone/menaquinone biosynthesis C-methylase UbiE
MIPSSLNPSQTEPEILENNGERMVPEVSGWTTVWEHVYRYAFACHLVKGQRVLDIACGEGYGGATLHKAGAASVIGVDISENVCLHARKKYGLDARPGSAENIPLAEASVDLVVSFETIEHVRDPGRFLDECARTLVPGGRLVISTPNKNVYSRPGAAPNPHHCSEMTVEEFTSALRARFCRVRLYTQRPYSAAWWSLRTLASDIAPRIPGFARLRESARFRLFPKAVRGPTIEQRRSVVEEILQASRGLTSPLNPYAVRPRRKWTLEKPTYFIAIATR